MRAHRVVGTAIAFALAWVPLTASAAAAQRQRKECTQAASELAVTRDRARIWTALGAIASCPEDGPIALAAFWRRPVAGEGLHDIALASGQTRDERVFAELLRVIAGKDYPRVVRSAALEAAFNITDSLSVKTFGALLDSTRRGWVDIHESAGTHRVVLQRSVGRAPTGDPTGRLKETMAELMRDSADDAYLMAAMRTIWRDYWRLELPTLGRPPE